MATEDRQTLQTQIGSFYNKCGSGEHGKCSHKVYNLDVASTGIKKFNVPPMEKAGDSSVNST